MNCDVTKAVPSMGDGNKGTLNEEIIQRRTAQGGRRRKFDKFVENENSVESETYPKASKIAKFSFHECQPVIYEELVPVNEVSTDVPSTPQLPVAMLVSCTTDTVPAIAVATTTTATATVLEKVNGRNKFPTKDSHKRNSYVINTLPSSISCRPQSLASPPLTAPMTSSLTEFNFHVDLVSCLSTDSAISLSSSAQELSIASIPSSSLASLSVPHSSSSSISLQSFETPLPQPPPPEVLPPFSADLHAISPPFLRHKAVRHSTIGEDLQFNNRMTQLNWSEVKEQTSWSDVLENVNNNFQSLTIDRKCLRDKAFLLGKKKFNLNPKKGIEYLVHLGLLRSTPESVAEFLYKREGLRKAAIGDFLGERNAFNLDVLKTFVGLHRFTGMLLVEALRQFLWNFRLPGESQKIDRIMEHFATKYCLDNPQAYTNSDTCFVLSYALVMLNTSLHNMNVKEKLTPERFEAMVKLICKDEKITSEMLMILYKNIKKEPLKFPEESGHHDISTFFNPTKEGWLLKKSEKYNQWQKRWFVLSDGCLYYFTYKTDKQPRVIVPLENLRADFAEDKKREYCFEIASVGQHHDNNNNNNNNNNNSNGIIKSCKTQSSGKVIQGTRSNFKLSASSVEECLEWINCINNNVTENPLQKLVVDRKPKFKSSLRSISRVTSFFSSMEDNEETFM